MSAYAAALIASYREEHERNKFLFETLGREGYREHMMAIRDYRKITGELSPREERQALIKAQVKR